MAGFSNPLVGGSGALVYPAIRSPNFNLVTQQGWAIEKNGQAYLFQLTVQQLITKQLYFPETVFLPPSGDPTGNTDTAVINTLFSDGYRVFLTGGIYYINSTITMGAEQYLLGIGRWQVILKFIGTGDCIRLQNPNYGGNGLWGGGVKDLTIDGTGAGAGSCGLHLGDGEQYELNVAVQNFTGAGDIGVHFDNAIWWTEKAHGTIYARNCTSHVVFDVTGALTSTNSFGYLDLTCYLYIQPDQDGVVIQNGAYPYHGRLIIKGDVQNQTAHVATNAALRIIGSMPAGHPDTNGSSIARCQLDIQLEVPANASGNTFQPFSVNFDNAPTNYIQGCYGIMDFTQGGGVFQPCNVNVASTAGAFSYLGPVIGDGNLNPSGTNFAQPAVIGTMIYSQSFGSGVNGSIFTQWGDFFSFTLSANIVINFNPAGQSCISAPQRKTIRIAQAAAGGPFTVTWPNPGAPTLTNPAFHWPGGAAPVMSAGANAVDIYKLETVDGIIWHCEALQNML